MSDLGMRERSNESPIDLSVIVPALNVEAWIDEALRSILSQDIERMEVIVVDDGSVDGTIRQVESWRDLDSRISILASGGVGGGSARNLGAARARGRYLIFVDADDIVPRGAFRTLLAQLDQSGSDMAAGRYLKFSASRTWDPTVNWPVYKRLVQATTLASTPSLIRGRACWNKMFRTEFWRATGLLFPDVPRSNDILPMTSAMNRAASIDVLPEIVYLYRERPGAGSMTALGASFSGFYSYAEQELRCANELNLTDESPVSRTYGRLVLGADLWVHTMRLVATLQRPETKSEEAEREAARVAESITALFDAVPVESRRALRPEQRAVYDVLRHGHLTMLSGLTETASVGLPETLGSLTAIQADWATALRLAELHPGFTALPADVIRERMLVPLALRVDEAVPESAQHWASRIRGLIEQRPSELTTLTEAERSLLSVAGDGDELKIVRSLRQVGPAVAVLCRRRNRFELRVPALPTGAVARARLRLRDGVDEVVLVSGLQGGSLVQFDVTSRRLTREGVWLMELSIAISGLVADHPVVSVEASPAWKTRRLSRVVTSPVLREGNQLVLIKRPRWRELVKTALTSRRRALSERLHRR